MFDTIRFYASIPVFLGQAIISSIPVIVDDVNQAICNKLFS